MTYIKVVKINKKGVLGIIVGIFAIACLFAIFSNKGKEEGSAIFVLEEGVIVPEGLLNEERLSKISVWENLKGQEPTVLITHAHVSEEYAQGGTVEDVGKELSTIFATKYGISVVHDVSVYDVLDGKRTVEGAYERMEKNVATILERYPSIKVVVDLHRDATDESEKIVFKVDEKDMAPLMLVNGICIAEGAKENIYLNENLALSQKVYKLGSKKYNGIFKQNYVKPYRYSTHFKPCSVLVEVGYQTNSLEEAKNSLLPLADTLVKAIESK